MKKNLFLIYLIFFAILFAGIKPLYAQSVFPPGELYFSPATSLEDKLAGFIKQSQGSIFLCTNSLDSKKIADALIDARTLRQLPVKVIIYKPNAAGNAFIEKFLYYGINVVLAENSDGFDFNFCMIDFNSVFLTSAPFNYKSLNQNYNYAMIVNSEKFAENFQYEFVEMFEGHYFGSASPSNTPNANININGAYLDTAFLPEDASDNKITSIISRAAKQIKIMSPELKNELINDNVIGRKNAISDITLIFNGEESGTQFTARPEYERYRKSGIYTALNKNYAKIECPFIVVDAQQVLLFGNKKAVSNTTLADSAFISINSKEAASMFTTFFDSIVKSNTENIVLKGQVVNSSNNLPLEGVRVWLSNLNAEIYTDYLGWYEMKGNLPDEFLISAEKEYYFSQDINFSKKNGTRLDFFLKSIVSYNSLSGFIISETTRLPISGCGLVAAYIENGTGTRTFIRTNTNEKGFFSFKALPVGKIDLEITHPNYQTKLEKAYEVKSGQAISLSGPLVLKPNYIITAYPNPIFEDNLFINIKDSNAGGQVPQVTIKQNNYAEIPVSMRIGASADIYNIYIGNYIIKKGYYGTARISVNGSMSYKDINIDFLEAYKNYTYSAPKNDGNVAFALNLAGESIKKSAFIAIQNDSSVILRGTQDLKKDGLCLLDGCEPVSVDIKSKAFSPADSSNSIRNNIEFKLPYETYKKNVNENGGVPAIYFYDTALGTWKYLKTATDLPEYSTDISSEVILKCEFSEPGIFGVLSDNTVPVVDSVKNNLGCLEIDIIDNGSGISERGLSLYSNNTLENAVSVNFINYEKNDKKAKFRISSIDSDYLKKDINVVLSDNSGNSSVISLKSIVDKAPAANSSLRIVEFYPNPCKSFGKFRVRSGENDFVTLKIYDGSGGMIFEVCEDSPVSQGVSEFNFNVNNLAIFKNKIGVNRLSNGVYFYKAIFASGHETNGKFSILK